MIEVSHLSKSFGSLSVLKDVSLNIRQGEIVVLLGPSGSGKSTLLRCLNGLEQADAGSVRIDSVHIEAAMRVKERKRQSTSCAA